jgi:hypothetical protein
MLARPGRRNLLARRKSLLVILQRCRRPDRWMQRRPVRRPHRPRARRGRHVRGRQPSPRSPPTPKPGRRPRSCCCRRARAWHTPSASEPSEAARCSPRSSWELPSECWQPKIGGVRLDHGHRRCREAAAERSARPGCNSTAEPVHRHRRAAMSGRHGRHRCRGRARQRGSGQRR